MRNQKTTHKEVVQRARQLRRDMTHPEYKLWSRLRNQGLAGLKFRRQHPVGPYIVDFVCEAKKLAIELDGDSHEGRYTYDIQRQKFIEQLGYRVIRFGNDDVLYEIDAVLDAILIAAGVDRDQIFG